MPAEVVLRASRLRTREPDPHAGRRRRRLAPALGVFVFYCFLSFFDGPQRQVGLRQHFAFLFEIFGIDRWMQAI